MLNVFISHSHGEKELAHAWKELLENVSQGAIEVWLSSDTSPAGGIKIGSEWRENIYNMLSKADYVLAILSPRSIEKPWILWECGVASGTNKERGIIPVFYSLPPDFGGPMSTYQVYAGDDREKVIEVCERLMTEAQLQPKKQYWGPMIDHYISTIRLFKPARTAGPSDIQIWMRRIEDFINSGRTAELTGLIDTMYASFGSEHPIDAQIHETLSTVFLEQKSYGHALQEVEKAIKLMPGDLTLLHRKALILVELQERGQARELLDYIHQEYPDARYLPEIAGLQGRLHRELFEATGRKEEIDNAINAYKLAYDRDPLSYYCGVNVVALRTFQGDYDGACEMAREVLAACQRLVAHSKVSYWLDFTIGELHLVLGELDAALQAYAEGLQRTPAPGLRSRESALNGLRRTFETLQLDESRLPEFEKLLG